jgi:hypothetical protein
MSHRAIYAIVGGVLGVLLIVMLVTYNYNKSNDEALAKATQLTTTLSQAGLPTPRDPAAVARVFGTDGGAVCASVQNGVALGIAKFNLSVGGEFYRRAVIADRRVAAGLLAVVKTYCPEKVPDVQQFIDSQHFETVVRG